MPSETRGSVTKSSGQKQKPSRVVASWVINTRKSAISPDEAEARLLVMEALTVQKCLFMLPRD